MNERIEIAKKMFLSTVTTSVDFVCSELNKEELKDDMTAADIFDIITAYTLSALQSYANKTGLNERVK